MNASTDWLVATAGRSALGLLCWSWQALVLMTCVWLALRICRVKSPTLRHQIWLFSLIAVAVMPSASEVTRTIPAIRPTSPTLSYVVDAPRLVFDLAPHANPQNGPVAAPLKSPAHAFPSVTLSFVLPSLFAFWLVGSLVVLARLMKGQADLWRARNRAKPISVFELDVPAFKVLITSKVRLRLSDEIDSPLLCGVFRLTILLPADIVEWTTPSERSAMIQHELAHVERLDPFVNLFQTALRVVFFFHPLVRFASRQLSLERELACHDRVVALGTNAKTYAEGLLKVAERSLMPTARHQLAFSSTKQILERRIEMILNSDRVRAGARHWKAMILSAGLIAVATWFLIPAGSAQPGSTPSSAKSPASKLRVVKRLGDEKAYDKLIEMALRNTDPELRRLAAIRLTELEGDGSTQAMVALYDQTEDPEVKTMLIEAFAHRSEMEPLTKIALTDSRDENRQRALRRIKFLKENSESADVRNWDVSALADQLKQVSAELPPPPPPPPTRVSPRKRGLPPPPPPPQKPDAM